MFCLLFLFVPLEVYNAFCKRTIMLYIYFCTVNFTNLILLKKALISRNVEICLWNKLCKNIMFLLLPRAIRGWDSTVTSIHMNRSSLENNQTDISLVKQTKVTISLLVLWKYESSTDKYDWLFLRGKYLYVWLYKKNETKRRLLFISS